MKKIINAPETYVDDMLKGIYAAHADQVKYAEGDLRCYCTAHKKPGKVAIITGGGSGHLPLFLAGMTNGRSFPAIAEKPFRDIFPTIEQKVENPKGKIALFAGCLLDFVYTDLARDVIANLNSIGYVVDMPMDQSCCGCPAASIGDVESAAVAAKINIEGMNAEEYDYIVSACPSCTHQLHKYPEYFEEGTEMHKRAVELAGKSVDFCKLFHDLGGISSEGNNKAMKVTYHDSCHLCRSMRVTQEQRELITAMPGVELVEMADHDNCCGFAGAYGMLLYPEISGPILQKKIDNILATGADTVAMDCPGCMMQIKGGLDARGIDSVKVKHTAEIIAEKRGLV